MYRFGDAEISHLFDCYTECLRILMGVLGVIVQHVTALLKTKMWNRKQRMSLEALECNSKQNHSSIKSKFIKLSFSWWTNIVEHH